MNAAQSEQLESAEKGAAQRWMPHTTLKSAKGGLERTANLSQNGSKKGGTHTLRRPPPPRSGLLRNVILVVLSGFAVKLLFKLVLFRYPE